MFDLNQLSSNIRKLNKSNLDKYIESIYVEFDTYLAKTNEVELQSIKYSLEAILYDLLKFNLVDYNNSTIVNAFLILLAEQFEKLQLTGAIVEIVQYLPNSSVKLRLEAAVLYLKVNDLTTQYHNRFTSILSLLSQSNEDETYFYKTKNALLLYLISAIKQFHRVNNTQLLDSFRNLFLNHKKDYKVLQDESIQQTIKTINFDNYLGLQFTKASPQTTICDNVNSNLVEDKEYANQLQALDNPTFESIRNIAYKYIQSIGDPQELYDRLQRGEKIIDDEDLLYKYLVSFGGKHKLKLDSAYELIIDKLQNQKFDIVDWGCGQATATMLLLNYAKKKNITLDIENITLIEPSSLALSRGLLHIDILKQKEYNIKAINSDLDCLDSSEIIQNKNKTLHLFSNILDVESFSLDSTFFKKTSKTIQNDALFVCVSPYRNDKHNNRLDLFYKYFDENFDTDLISAREDDIGNSTRYEKIFEVKYVDESIIEEKRQEIKAVEKSYHLDIIQELDKYSNYIVPILDMKFLEDSIGIDPEYAVFKIRKVAEVLTSKIYSNYEDNSKTVSFNDKIRYLSYEKKVFDKTITNYVQTIRTIGNRGVHEDDRELAKLKLDAHLMVIALVSFIQELIERKLI